MQSGILGGSSSTETQELEQEYGLKLNAVARAMLRDGPHHAAQASSSAHPSELTKNIPCLSFRVADCGIYLHCLYIYNG
jgi:hypothetical protein